VSVRGRILLALLIALAAAALPAAASAHAYLIGTSPTASGVLDQAPKAVALTFDEAVEPRFAIISVTNAAGKQLTSGTVNRSPANPDTLLVPLRPGLPEGWYLIYWRAISVDGHPVQGAFTYAIGPNPGPAPQFPVPSVSATAVTPQLLIARWAMFLTVMSAIGLYVMRMLIARPAVRRAQGTSLRSLSRAFVVASVLGLIAIPVYLDFAIANDSLRSVFDLGALVPLFRVTAFARGYLDMELCFGLFCVAAWISLWVDRPERERRSVAELAAQAGTLLAAAAVLVVPGAIGHAGQTSPRGLSVPLDWVHLIAGSLWIGGLIGLLVLWSALPAAKRTAGLAVSVPRFSNVAFVSVVVLLGSGIGAAVIHLPTLATLWQTGYGKTIIIKASLLLAAMLVASVNLLRTKPALARGENAESAAILLRRLVGVEVVLVTSAIVAAAVLSSFPPPPKALASLGAPAATAGPGPVTEVVERNGYKVDIRVTPNKVAVPDDYTVRITRNGTPVRGATVIATFTMLDMEMPTQAYRLAERSPGTYEHSSEALVMVGRWGLTFEVQPAGAQAFDIVIVDHAAG